MEKFIKNLKTQAEENPYAALFVAAIVITSISRLIDASGHAAGSRAYARQVDNRIRRPR
jgi:hypothetical protein